MARKPMLPYPGPGFPHQIHDVAYDKQYLLYVLTMSDFLKEVMRDKGFLIQAMEYPNTGDITSNISGEHIGIAAANGYIKYLNIFVGQLGTDTNPLSISVDIKKNGVSILDDPIVIESHESDGTASDTVLLTELANHELILGDRISMDLAVTRTATPSTEMADLVVSLGITP